MAEEEDQAVVEYESPTAEERRRMQEAQGLHITPEDQARMEQADQEFVRMEAMRLAVTWTAPTAAVGPVRPEDIGPLMGIADLFQDYIRTGKKPTEHQAKNALKEFRR